MTRVSYAQNLNDEPGDDGWDDELASDLVGSIVIIGLTRIGPDGSRQFEDFWGMVVRVDPQQGVEFELHGENAGDTWFCPPDLSAFEKARSGTYTLRSTGEVIIDPHYTTKWTVTAPAS